MSNRLAHETSPYLLQHKDNPVDWYPWGDEALERAKSLDWPILLSVGYSACHWCHVMEEESFADEETARLMNERFVSIKVDREERPDVDSIYMSAVQQMTGRGGWPMTVFLTPDGSPFYGGTYYPPEPRHGLPSFRQVLEAVSEAWNDRRGEVERGARELRQVLQQNAELNPGGASVNELMLGSAFQKIATQFDERNGGFGAAPKFPQPMILEFLLRSWARNGDMDSLNMVEESLQKMAAGGIRDHLGGGFHRYTVDARWLVPHFEKMLYDNAQLSRVYVLAYQATGEPEYERIARETLDYVLREMRSPDGGFYSAQDADSEGEEGRFYVWSADAVDEVLGAEDGPLFRAFFDITSGGNWEGRNILHTPRAIEDVASEAGVEIAHLREVVDRGRPALYKARGERIWPARDEKIITSWNAMMLRAFADAAFVLNSEEYRRAAMANAEFILREMRAPDGGLLRTWKDGVAKIDGFLEDYATLVDALISVYRATWNPRWVREARAIAELMLDRFWDEDQEMFFDTAIDSERLVIRPRDLFDNATPSGNSSAVTALLRLAPMVGEPRYARIGSRVIESTSRLIEELPTALGQMLNALDKHLAAPREVAIVGGDDSTATLDLLAVLRERYLPNVTLALSDPRRDTAGAEEVIPLLADRGTVDGAAAAYVCERFACQRPVTTAGELRAEIERSL